MSKIFAPGVRVGWVHAPHPILHRINLAKQGADLCTSTFAQLVCLRFLQHGRRDDVLARMRALYGARRDAMVKAIDEFLPDAAYTTPRGGLFFWVTLADGLDTTDLLAAALERNVAFVPGRAAFVDGVQGASSMRLNFSAANEERIAEGVRLIGDVARERASLARALGRRRDG
jgi:2-aminoadipate transaminase